MSGFTDRVYAALPVAQTPAPFLITPLTARVGSREVFRVEIMPGYRPIDRWGVTAVTVISHDGTGSDGNPLLWDDYQQLEFSFEGKTMLFTAFFHQEGKYTVQLRCGERVAMEVAVYALEEDLYGCVALKGDFHSHSYASDGKHAPGLAAMRGRKCGLDFMSVTDHGVYQGSLDAIAALKDTR